MGLPLLGRSNFRLRPSKLQTQPRAAMASDTFKKLYESSKLLVSPPNREQYPIITRDWNHLRNETQNIFGRNKLNQEQKANGYRYY